MFDVRVHTALRAEPRGEGGGPPFALRNHRAALRQALRGRLQGHQGEGGHEQIIIPYARGGGSSILRFVSDKPNVFSEPNNKNFKRFFS